ncbi:MAG: MBL fold metallo-hydrolase [Candidatus Aenigmarchaeota archaeon]|nr:MBL fold metallo-hydrolase [Candidatus Aenigmarchaeota archaeon]
MHGLKVKDMKITWLGHASFLIENADKKIYIDPFVLHDNPEKADVILITHEHFDHFDMDKINSITSEKTEFFGPAGVIKKSGFGKVVRPDDTVSVSGVKIEVVEAYNVNKKFHPKGLGVGFVVDTGVRIYHAGDTDCIKEMKDLKNIDIALLPVGGYYTMNVKEAADAANSFAPKIVVPMHYNSDKYGITGINANAEDLKKMIPGTLVLEPLV